MPFYDVTGSYTGSCELLVTLVIPPGMMLTGTVSFLINPVLSGSLTGSFFGDASELSGSLSDPLSGSYTIDASGSSSPMLSSTLSFSGSYTGSLSGTFYSDVILTVPENYALMGTVQFTVTGTIEGPMTGSLFTFDSSGSLSGTLGSDTLSGSAYAAILVSDAYYLKKLGIYEDTSRMRRTYPFFRPRAKKLRYILE
jgi:hypothetical protein